MIAMSVLALFVCLAQFGAGRIIGLRYGDPVSGAQSLGQKNTVLAIWMALTYLGSHCLDRACVVYRMAEYNQLRTALLSDEEPRKHLRDQTISLALMLNIQRFNNIRQ